MVLDDDDDDETAVVRVHIDPECADPQAIEYAVGCSTAR